MDRETTCDYLRKSDFSPMQADALSRLLSQTVTKEDLRIAVQELEKSDLAIRSEIMDAMHRMKAELQESIHRVEANMTRWMITLLVTLGGLLTLFKYFLD